MMKHVLPFLFLVFLTGCFQVDDQLTVAADGSGRVHLEVKNTLPAQLAAQISMAEGLGGHAVIYPPLNEDQARQFFPAKDFTVEAKQRQDGDANTLVVDASFKDVNALLGLTR